MPNGFCTQTNGIRRMYCVFGKNGIDDNHFSQWVHILCSQTYVNWDFIHFSCSIECVCSMYVYVRWCVALLRMRRRWCEAYDTQAHQVELTIWIIIWKLLDRKIEEDEDRLQCLPLSQSISSMCKLQVTCAALMNEILWQVLQSHAYHHCHHFRHKTSGFLTLL